MDYRYTLIVCVFSLSLVASCFRSQPTGLKYDTKHNEGKTNNELKFEIFETKSEHPNVLNEVNTKSNRQKSERDSAKLRKNGRPGTHGEYATCVYGNKRRKVWREQSNYPEFLDPEVTILSTDSLPFFTKFMPTIGNGYLATVARSNTIYRSDIFTGYNQTSHRARIQSTSSLQITSASLQVNSERYSLDMGRGMYYEDYKGDNFHIQVKMFAHRVLKGALVTELYVNTTKTLTLKLAVNSGQPSDDLVIIKNETDDKTIAYVARPKQMEYNTSENDVFILATKVPNQITFQPNMPGAYLFLTAIGNSEDTAKGYQSQAYSMYSKGSLETTHTDAWAKEWQKGRIDVSGNPNLAKVNYASLYYIMSSILPPDPDILVKPWPFIGLSPGGLAHGALGKDYDGHVFWDQETWMYPPVLMLHSDLGKIIIDSRIRTLDSAKQNAKYWGYKGARFPWESAYTGLEVCPAVKFAKYEQHITGDIAFAVNQYYMLTNDVDFIKNGRGGELINEIATYWQSRVVYNNKTMLYEIPGVMPPDEYHSPVDNSAYTNSIAKLSLLMTKDILPLVNMSYTQYIEIGNNMYIPFNEVEKWHPEYDGYKQGVLVKQADVVLLGFPLMLNITPEVRKNDLTIYEKVTPAGPAMTWGMFSIGWIELGEMSKAKDLFELQLLNVNKPFNVWSEVPLGLGAINFITGAGGYLQSLIFGYGGFRIHSENLEFNGHLPPNVTSFNITGVDYLQGSIDFTFSDVGMSVTQTKSAIVKLMVVISSTGEQTMLDLGKTLSFKRQKASIYPVNSRNFINKNL